MIDDLYGGCQFSDAMRSVKSQSLLNSHEIESAIYEHTIGQARRAEGVVFIYRVQ